MQNKEFISFSRFPPTLTGLILPIKQQCVHRAFQSADLPEFSLNTFSFKEENNWRRSTKVKYSEIIWHLSSEEKEKRAEARSTSQEVLNSSSYSTDIWNSALSLNLTAPISSWIRLNAKQVTASTNISSSAETCSPSNGTKNLGNDTDSNGLWFQATSDTTTFPWNQNFCFAPHGHSFKFQLQAVQQYLLTVMFLCKI